MTNTKHTPGPWHATAHGSLKSNIVYDAEGFAICDCKTFHDGNARLIAAAPDLLAALKDIATYAAYGRPLLAEALARIARAAIAKAEG